MFVLLPLRNTRRNHRIEEKMKSDVNDTLSGNTYYRQKKIFISVSSFIRKLKFLSSFRLLLGLLVVLVLL